MSTPSAPEGAPQRIRALLGLRELLLNGDFRPGERLAEIPLGERLGVSRTPLRLAMTELEHEGLLQAKGSGGFVVSEFTLEDAADAIEVRGVLEGTAARFAAERAPDARSLERLGRCVADLDEFVHGSDGQDLRETFATYVELNERFHRTLVELAGSAMLARSIEHAVAVPFASPDAFVRAQAELPTASRVLVVGQEQHRSILHAIESGQGARAESVAREHARLALSNLEAAIAAGEPFERVPGRGLIRLVDQQSATPQEEEHAV